ncbi:MAG: acyl-CoA dehydrogenase family protein [Acidimicrobiia bacterium]
MASTTSPQRQALRDMEAVVERGAAELRKRVTSSGRVDIRTMDRFQPAAYQLAFLASEAHGLAVLIDAAEAGTVSESMMCVGSAHLLVSARSRLDGQRDILGADTLDGAAVRRCVAEGHSPRHIDAALESAGDLGVSSLDADMRLAASEFARYGEAVVAPRADAIHRGDTDLPEEIISGLAAMGAFGLSIPTAYGGSRQPDKPDHLAMVVATEALSRYSLGAGGSLITRPEILARAVMAGGTEAQKRRWLPAIASGDKLVAVAVTEPDSGSDVAALAMRAHRRGDRWILDGTKTWSTFAGRAELVMVLARTDPDPVSRHRGLSLFVVEKPSRPGHEFHVAGPRGGTLSGVAIPTIGYRGMHSFELHFDGWAVPHDDLVGGDAGIGRGFHLQMEAFAAGRLQTAARAVGVAEAAFRAAAGYATERRAFGTPLIGFGLTRHRLAVMAARIATNRLFTYSVAIRLGDPAGQQAAAMVKALSCRMAEQVTRDAMQVFGGYGYAEEYEVSRLFVDARVLSIFEGSEEVLALRIIARRLVEEAGSGITARR